MLNYQTLLTPNTPLGLSLIPEVMAIAEIYPKEEDDAVFLVAYFVKVKGAKSTPYRKPTKFNLREILKAIKNNDIGIAKMLFPEFMLQDDECLSDKAIEQRDHRYCMLEEALGHGRNLYFRRHGDKIIQTLAEKYSMKRDKVQELINDYYRFGRRKNALISQRGRSRTKPSRDYKKLGRRRDNFDDGDIGTNVSSDAKAKMATIGRKLLLGEFNSTYGYAYNQYLTKYHDVDLLIDPRGIGTTIEIKEPNSAISFDQFYRGMPEALGFTRARLNKKRSNLKKYEANVEAHDGSAAAYAYGPGHIYQMDSTEMDLELVFSLDRSKLIGVVTLYVIRDVSSGSIVGLHIGVGKASFKEARMAIFNAFRNKKKFAAEYGVELTEDDWIEGGKCAVLLVDNEELANNISDAIPASANFEIRFSRTYRGDDKGLIESAFHIFHSLFKRHKMKGFKHKNILGRNRNKAKKEAILTINDAMKILIIYTVYHNTHLENPRIPIEAQARRDGVNKICREIWLWGLENRFFIPEEISDKELYVQLLENIKLKPDRGVFKIPETGLLYTIRGYIPNKELLDKASKNHLNKTFNCRYLRQLTNFVFIEINNQYHLAKLHSNDREYEDMSFAECVEIKAIQKSNSKKLALENKKYALGTAYDINTVIDNAEKLTASAIKESGQPRIPKNCLVAKDIESQMAESHESERIINIANSEDTGIDILLIENTEKEKIEPIKHESDDEDETTPSTYESTMLNMIRDLNNDD